MKLKGSVEMSAMSSDFKLIEENLFMDGNKTKFGLFKVQFSIIVCWPRQLQSETACVF